jgi:hypothetical protein
MDRHFAPKEVELLVARKGFRLLRGNARGGSKLLGGVIVTRGQRPQYFKDRRRRLRAASSFSSSASMASSQSLPKSGRGGVESARRSTVQSSNPSHGTALVFPNFGSARGNAFT